MPPQDQETHDSRCARMVNKYLLRRLFRAIVAVRCTGTVSHLRPEIDPKQLRPFAFDRSPGVASFCPVLQQLSQPYRPPRNIHVGGSGGSRGSAKKIAARQFRRSVIRPGLIREPQSIDPLSPFTTQSMRSVAEHRTGSSADGIGIAKGASGTSQLAQFNIKPVSVGSSARVVFYVL